MAELRKTPDSGLVTEAAIRFRIEELRNDRTLAAQPKLRRIRALKARLPEHANQPVRKYVDIHSKSDENEFGRTQVYASAEVTCIEV